MKDIGSFGYIGTGKILAKNHEITSVFFGDIGTGEVLAENPEIAGEFFGDIGTGKISAENPFIAQVFFSDSGKYNTKLTKKITNFYSDRKRTIKFHISTSV